MRMTAMLRPDGCSCSSSSSSTVRPGVTQQGIHAMQPSPPATPAMLSGMVLQPGEKPRVLITGATGLLGQQVLRSFGEPWEVHALGFSRASRAHCKVHACDLTAEGAAARWVEDFRPHVVLHLAAERRLEVLERNAGAAELLNVQATAELAKACEQQGSWLLFLSCDSVFSGASPPYDEDSSPDPVTPLGRQKLRAESMVTAASRHFAILRVPLLYGPVDDLKESAVTSVYADLRRGVRRADDRHLYYPTFAPDVANVIRSLVELHKTGTEVSGIFHWQSGEQYTIFEIMSLTTKLFGFGSPGITPERAEHQRPGHEDRRLLCARLEALLDVSQYRTPLEHGIMRCILPVLPVKAAQSISAQQLPGTEWCSTSRSLSGDRLATPSSPQRSLSMASSAFTGATRAAPADRTALLRSACRSNAKVLQQTGSDVRRMRQRRSHLRKEAERLRAHPDERLSKEELQRTLAREKALDEALNWKVREEMEAAELVSALQRELSQELPKKEAEPGVLQLFGSVPGLLDRKLLAQNKATASASTLVASSSRTSSPYVESRQPRAESPAFAIEVRRLVAQNEDALKRLKAENERLKQLCAEKGLEGEIHETTSYPSPRSSFGSRSRATTRGSGKLLEVRPPQSTGLAVGISGHSTGCSSVPMSHGFSSVPTGQGLSRMPSSLSLVQSRGSSPSAIQSRLQTPAGSHRSGTPPSKSTIASLRAAMAGQLTAR
eukprot:TRINITY_DN1728_c1_g1_i1.p1 TRINITY_DN1728_c1_g1~~TRINITY_DN1728_c1_g1_i1.p1  ORF type:complete len:722 (+),score=128.36 TRINITY_DN1728_c1_g1_i1:43-2208(+)